MILQKTGNITYNGENLNEFHVKRTSAYISQTDNHIAELTVRETLDFAARCQGASEGFAGFYFILYGVNYYLLYRCQIFHILMLYIIVGYMKDLTRLEKERGIHPCSEIDAFMKVNILKLLTSFKFILYDLLVIIMDSFVIGCFC